MTTTTTTTRHAGTENATIAIDAAENLWILRSLLAGQWTAAHTARNSIEPIRLSPPAHPVRIV